MQTEKNEIVVQISTALSNKPMFVKIADLEMGVDRVITEAISTLRNTNRPLEADQLEQLYRSHTIFNEGNVVAKSDLMKDLHKRLQTIGETTVAIIPLDLLTAHSGGMGCIHYHRARNCSKCEVGLLMIFNKREMKCDNCGDITPTTPEDLERIKNFPFPIPE